MVFDPNKGCPFRRHKPCVQHDCQLFIRMLGMDRNTGQSVDEWGCAIAWTPPLIVEAAQQSREAGAAIESLRNEIAAGLRVISQALAAPPQFGAVIEQTGKPPRGNGNTD